MKFYRTTDGAWHATQADAKAHSRATKASWFETDVPTDKPGLLTFLNEMSLLGRIPATLGPAPTPAPTPASNYTAQSVAIDEAWEMLSLARKLSFAALAMEEARSKL